MYRDDRDALLARLDAVTRENQQLRARNAELERPPPSPATSFDVESFLEDVDEPRRELRAPLPGARELPRERRAPRLRRVPIAPGAGRRGSALVSTRPPEGSRFDQDWSGRHETPFRKGVEGPVESSPGDGQRASAGDIVGQRGIEGCESWSKHAAIGLGE